MRTVTAFVAHSFASEDEPKIRPILAQLDAFHEMGFVWKSGESAEADRVSDKIRRRILDAQVFIGIMTHKHPVFNLTNVFKSAWELITNKLQPTRWTPPGWVIQESGFALALERKVILFVEPNLDFPALQGDLEYVPYDYLHPEDAVTRVSQMISKLIAEQAGIRVETVVRDESEGQEKAETISPTTEAKETATGSQSSEPGLAEIFGDFRDAISKKDLVLARKQLDAGVELITKGDPDAKALAWRCHCLVILYRAGDVPAFQELKRLETENQDDPIPARAVGDALWSFKEFSEAANYYKMAAERATDKDDRDSFWLECADALIEAKLPDQAEPILNRLLKEAQQELRTQAAEKLYGILKSSSRYFEAFGTAEVLLHENPGSQVFALVLD
jgi:tetratricopeptide (TPR) repeat protein